MKLHDEKPKHVPDRLYGNLRIGRPSPISTSNTEDTDVKVYTHVREEGKLQQISRGKGSIGNLP